MKGRGPCIITWRLLGLQGSPPQFLSNRLSRLGPKLSTLELRQPLLPGRASQFSRLSGLPAPNSRRGPRIITRQLLGILEWGSGFWGWLGIAAVVYIGFSDLINEMLGSVKVYF